MMQRRAMALAAMWRPRCILACSAAVTRRARGVHLMDQRLRCSSKSRSQHNKRSSSSSYRPDAINGAAGAALPGREMAATAVAGAGLRSEFLRVLLSRRRDLQVQATRRLGGDRTSPPSAPTAYSGAAAAATAGRRWWRRPAVGGAAKRDPHGGVADMVDEAVAMAFGHAAGSNYVRVQAGKAPTPLRAQTAAAAAGAMLAQRNVESVLFRGRRLSERANAEKVDALAAELVKEQERRWHSPLRNVTVKKVGTPRA